LNHHLPPDNIKFLFSDLPVALALTLNKENQPNRPVSLFGSSVTSPIYQAGAATNSGHRINASSNQLNPALRIPVEPIAWGLGLHLDLLKSDVQSCPAAFVQ
jgi:hypothetical protein